MSADAHRKRPLAPGTTVGRWTIIRPATPAQLNGWMRRRHLARCVCGRTQLVFEHYLRHGRSKGCASAACRHAWQAKQRG